MVVQKKIDASITNDSSFQKNEEAEMADDTCDIKPDTNDSLQFYPTLNIADYDQLLATIRQLKSWPSTAKSPSVSFTLSGVESVATLDEGAEVNCMNLKFAKNVM